MTFSKTDSRPITAVPTLKSEPRESDSTGIVGVMDRVQATAFAEFLPVEDITRPVLATVPAGRTLVALKPLLDQYRSVPERRQGTARLTSVDGFILHVQRFGMMASGPSPSAVIFAHRDPKNPGFTAVYDYHPASARAGTADWLAHRAYFGCRLAPAWQAWSELNGKWMGQAEFAQVIEDRLTDFVSFGGGQLPVAVSDLIELLGARLGSPGALVTLSRGLEVNLVAQVKNATTLESGEIAVVYVEEHRDGAGQPIRTPNLFLAVVPVFEGGGGELVPVRLRYRQRDRKLEWSFHLHRPDQVFESAYAALASKIAAATQLPMFDGAPEA